MSIKQIFSVAVICLTVLPFLQSCGEGGTGHAGESRPISMRHATHLKMDSLDKGITYVAIRNPWDTTKVMGRYVLVEKGAEIPDGLPDGTVRINVPIDRSVVYSSVHVSLIDELGRGDAVRGVCDAAFINDATIKEDIKSGKISDCGSSQSPNIERIVSLRPQVVILSPYKNSDEESRFKRTGISTISAADYMEPTPLARAEWMRFYGRLYGVGAKADSLFRETESAYESISKLAKGSATRPKVLFDRIYSGTWDVPTDNSVTGHYIADAGGINPFAGSGNAGSVHLPAERVLYEGSDCDIWLIRYYEPSLTLADLKNDNPVYTKFKAYKDGNVFGANTLAHPLFEDGAFHPQLILTEMVKLLHPELNIEGNSLRYYVKMN